MRALRIKFLEKYAALAEDLLIKQGDPYTPDDVEKVAEFLIKADFQRADEIDQVENLVKQGQLQAQGFANELSKIAGKDALEKLALGGFLKTLAGKAGTTYGNAFVKLKNAKSKAQKALGKAKKVLKNNPKESAGIFAGGVGTGALLSD